MVPCFENSKWVSAQRSTPQVAVVRNIWWNKWKKKWKYENKWKVETETEQRRAKSINILFLYSLDTAIFIEFLCYELLVDYGREIGARAVDVLNTDKKTEVRNSRNEKKENKTFQDNSSEDHR